MMDGTQEKQRWEVEPERDGEDGDNVKKKKIRAKIHQLKTVCK